MAGRRKLGSASLKTGRLIWPCLAGERGPDGRGKWPYAYSIIIGENDIVFKKNIDYSKNGLKILCFNDLENYKGGDA